MRALNLSQKPKEELVELPHPGRHEQGGGLYLAIKLLCFGRAFLRGSPLIINFWWQFE